MAVPEVEPWYKVTVVRLDDWCRRGEGRGEAPPLQDEEGSTCCDFCGAAFSSPEQVWLVFHEYAKKSLLAICCLDCIGEGTHKAVGMVVKAAAKDPDK